MFRLKILIKILFLIPVLLLAFVADVIIFAFANSCSSCVSFPQYLLSNFSLFNIFLISLTSLFGLLVRRK